MTDRKENAPLTQQDGARGRLIDAGLYLFATHGLEGVRTRALADRAGVNQSAIPYYFGGKDGVYAAVIAAIADDMAAGLSAAGLPDIAAAAGVRPHQTAPDLTACADALRRLMKAYTLAILAPGKPIERTLLIVREQLAPTPNFDLLFQRFIEPLHQTISILVARLQGRAPDEVAVITQAHALVGQALAFVVARQAYLRRTHCPAIDHTTAEHIAQTVAHMALNAVHPVAG